MTDTALRKLAKAIKVVIVIVTLSVAMSTQRWWLGILWTIYIGVWLWERVDKEDPPEI